LISLLSLIGEKEISHLDKKLEKLQEQNLINPNLYSWIVNQES
jgi:hypothetical protein